MQFNSFLEDINDEEDYAQYRALLLLLGLSEEGADEVLTIRKQQFKRKAELVEEAAISRAEQPPAAGANDGLDEVIFCTSDLLEDIPLYHRYILYLLSEMTNDEVSKIVGMPRNTMWRWLLKHGYPLKQLSKYS
jgi:hypothetical protein